MNSPNLQYFLQVNRIFFVDTNTNEGVSLPIYSHWKLLGKATAFHQCCCKTWHGPNNKSCTTRWLLTRSLLNLCPLEIFTFAPSLAFNLLTPPIFKGSDSRCWLSKRGTGKGSLDVLVNFSLIMSSLLKVTSGKPQVSNIVSKDPFPALLLLVKKGKWHCWTLCTQTPLQPSGGVRNEGNPVLSPPLLPNTHQVHLFPPHPHFHLFLLPGVPGKPGVQYAPGEFWMWALPIKMLSSAPTNLTNNPAPLLQKRRHIIWCCGDLGKKSIEKGDIEIKQNHSMLHWFYLIHWYIIKMEGL